MTPLELVEQLQRGELLLGTLVVSSSPYWPKAIGACGLDFVFIDTEHIPMDRHQLSWMCQTYNSMGLPPLVRIPSPDPFSASMVLDGGAAGVIAPYVESTEQVQGIVGATRFRPIKGQKLSQYLRGDPLPGDLDSYLSDPAHRRLSIVNIESVPAMQSLDEIVRVSGLDAVLIGPHDLTCSLGIPEQYEHPEFLRACESIFAKARAANTGAGIHFWGTPQQQSRFVSMGANMLIHSGDLMLFQKHLAAELNAIRMHCGSQGNRKPLGSDSTHV